MGRKNFNAFIKKQKAEQKKKKKLAKQQKKNDREHKEGTLDNMLAYVDQDGIIVDEPPKEDENKEDTDQENKETRHRTG